MSSMSMTKPLLMLLLIFMSSFSLPALAVAPVAICAPGILQVLPYAQILEDPSRILDADQVAALGDSRFFQANAQAPSLAFTHSAVWLRFRVVNDADINCNRWLTVGEPRLENIQVYVQSKDDWTVMRAGSDYPLDESAVAERQPLFRLEVDAGESRLVLIRVTSRSWLLINPTFWDSSALLGQVMHTQLLDGLTLGVMLLVLPIGLLFSLLTRFKLLLLNSLALLFYLALIAVVNGYLVYWPTLLPWSRELVAVLSACAWTMFFSYSYYLLRVRRLSSWLGIVFALYAATGGLLLLWGAVGDFVWTRTLFAYFRNGAYLLIPLTFALALYQRVKLDWLAWSVCGLMLVQGGVGLAWQVEDDIWLYGEDKLGLSSALFIALLLMFTLIRGFVLQRKRELAALIEVTQMQLKEHERLENQVQLRTQQLRDLLHARSTLLARISHDLRSPLNSIINYARELRRGPADEQPDHIERHARQQLELLDDLLEFSRSELQQVELSLQPGYLFSFLNEIEAEGRYLATRQHNQWQSTLTDNLPLLVHADFRQLRRVLINLLNNAAKFTRNGLIQLKVETLESQSEAFHLRFSVIDTGIGVPPGFRDQLNTPFQRGANTLTTEGFGLGLSIVSDLLDQMDSHLCFTDNPGGGSVFSFDLQLDGASEDDMDQVFIESHIPSFEGVEYKIVLADDIELTRIFLGDLLEGYGLDVSLAQNGQEALAYLDAGPVDVLITDQIMPGMNGWELLRKVRQRWPGLPVLLYSASPARPEATHGDLHFDAVLLKPATTEELLGSIARLCQKTLSEPAP